MNLGRVQAGDWLQIPVFTDNATSFAAWPTDNAGAIVFPYVTIVDPTLTHQLLVMADQSLPAVDRFNSTALGLHAIWQRIGPELPVGLYYCYIEWQAASATSNRRRVHTFQVVAGGDVKGAYTSLTYYEKPQAGFIVGQTDGGLLESRRNPR